MWKYTGKERPAFAEEPAPGQESVWDYPRPPVLRPCDDAVEVRDGDALIARSSATLRVLETASPPTYYIPGSDVDWSQLCAVAHGSYCEWKGRADYFALARAPGTPVAWRYQDPAASFAAIDGCISFYPALVACFVNGERVTPQPGGFYGGWVTSRIVGPVKGEPGTGHW